ncbi:hypothetical protein MVEN_01416000 [Mycena venus]|uniref:Uncharacterized protein n=1 Tax=Mycena venus TaxID=2733690 RepID=A0A8H6XWQ1_9AGAR|nr:hypothetical protein MVEN_01416000 [Mycena venus]
MSDVNYDFFIHVVMMIYAERVDQRVQKKDLGLTEAFWAEATGDHYCDVNLMGVTYRQGRNPKLSFI